jgi:hypothetical protein
MTINGMPASSGQPCEGGACLAIRLLKREIWEFSNLGCCTNLYCDTILNTLLGTYATLHFFIGNNFNDIFATRILLNNNTIVTRSCDCLHSISTHIYFWVYLLV